MAAIKSLLRDLQTQLSLLPAKDIVYRKTRGHGMDYCGNYAFVYVRSQLRYGGSYIVNKHTS